MCGHYAHASKEERGGGHAESRQAICQLKPTQRTSWVSLALSYHLTGHFDTALDMLHTFRSSQDHVNRDLVGEVLARNPIDWKLKKKIKIRNRRVNYSHV